MVNFLEYISQFLLFIVSILLSVVAYFLIDFKVRVEKSILNFGVEIDKQKSVFIKELAMTRSLVRQYSDSLANTTTTIGKDTLVLKNEIFLFKNDLFNQIQKVNMDLQTLEAKMIKADAGLDSMRLRYADTNYKIKQYEKDYEEIVKKVKRED